MGPDELDLRLLESIDEQYTLRPFYGSRRMVVHQAAQGYAVNRKRVQRLMRILGLTEYFAFYNDGRPHQALGYRTPEAVHRSGEGGGARIAAELEQRQGAACEPTGTA